MTPADELERACNDIEAEMKLRVAELENEGDLIASKRLWQKTSMDLMNLREVPPAALCPAHSPGDR